MNVHTREEEPRVSAVALTQRARTRTRTNQEEHPSAWGCPVVDDTDTDVNANANANVDAIPAPLPGLDSGCSSWGSVGMLRGDEGGYIIQKRMDGGGRKRREREGEKAVASFGWTE
jgi:hypothetical protein